ncbi:MAG TPA: macrolide ABC transporter ATP-binding protein [Cryomorphaceae bacterium]|jgi:putative ABC transport system ATP-binding protein|nr:MAG: macrolide ABC transporter ATP-binding protein [Cryomorphaceae bacterium BACL7 MAG-120910-bin2]KRO68233.1 MAG: macrolide ABC transporter ATP-binding protein [Cryomorphaceae bacterium BACL7 MAG-120322-bin74]KRO83913.1 MAG: macrolide ABC transporter ATP-binding protein [Cryomorphaceae bacterium BACL7 MAG-121220-bin83]NQW24928.1 ABC transporter ATP-binding protein [Cryomorphaceae bacterium]HAB31537.1 macrolide ABC transporter ATP-binding protein [Cryomorphaceae bacterium]
MALIELKNVIKVYKSQAGNVTAVDGISASFEEGEFTAIVGPSGCGKTTLLNAIGGLDRPNQGTIKIEGQDIAALKDRDLIDFRLQNIGFVFQAYNLIPVLTALENTAFILELQGVSKKEREARAMELLEAVGLADRAHNRPNQLSGGQQQRVAVARALASRPRFVLADEPTANLDSRSTETLLDIMANLNQREKTTFIFSTHDPRVIDRARRILLLEDGKIVMSK